jgi:hypothetical protein
LLKHPLTNQQKAPASDLSHKTKLRCSPIRVEQHEIFTIIEYRPKLNVFSVSCRFTQVIQNTQKEEGNFQTDI